MSKISSVIVVSAGLAVATLLAPGLAGAGPEENAAARAEIEATFGFVPTFMDQMPDAGFAGAWEQLRDLELSTETALDAKTKALIALAVVAQIPCTYCIWAGTESAKAAGATEQEIAEAVAIAATERYWSTMLNGLQVDLATFQEEWSRVFAVEEPAP